MDNWINGWLDGSLNGWMNRVLTQPTVQITELYFTKNKA